LSCTFDGRLQVGRWISQKEGCNGSTCAHGRARGFSYVTLDFPLPLLPAPVDLVLKCLIRVGSFHQNLIVPTGRRPTEPISLIDLALSSCTRRSPHQISSSGWLCTCAPDRSTAPPPSTHRCCRRHIFSSSRFLSHSPFSFPIIAACMHASCQRNFEPRQAPITLSPIFQLLSRTLAIVTPYSRPFLLVYSVSAETQSVFRPLRSKQINLQVQSYTTISP
jgi:hypothetical protein